MSEASWSGEERRQLVDAYANSARMRAAVAERMEHVRGADFDEVALLAEAVDHQTRLITRAYRDGLPRQPLARCPFTGQPSRLSIDPFGLDGMFWDCDFPIRPKTEPEAGPHFLSLTGAVRLAEAIEPTRFIATPGPGVPFVVPRVFERQDVIGVLSAGHIGAHTAYAVAYFAAQPGHDLYRPHLWGVEVEDMALTPGDDDPAETVEDYDFDLRPWIERRRLAWLKPGDAELTLRFDLGDCPFLDVPGVRQLQFLQYGETWTADDDED